MSCALPMRFFASAGCCSTSTSVLVSMGAAGSAEQMHCWWGL